MEMLFLLIWVFISFAYPKETNQRIRRGGESPDDASTRSQKILKIDSK